MYETAVRFGRTTPPEILRAATTRPSGKPMTAEQRRRQRFLNEEKRKTLVSLIAHYANSKRHFATVQQWRRELIELHARF